MRIFSLTYFQENLIIYFATEPYNQMHALALCVPWTCRAKCNGLRIVSERSLIFTIERIHTAYSKKKPEKEKEKEKN